MVRPKILVVGGGGQIGRELALLGETGNWKLCFPARSELDLGEERSIRSVLSEGTWDAVINCAAWTDVDGAEDHAKAARLVNATAPGMLARLTAASGVPLVHFSTDYVFSGKSAAPYLETDPTDPISVYGLTKRDGEDLVLAAHPRSIVLRVARVLSVHRSNFLKKMLELGMENAELSIVTDQVGCPTGARDAARASLAIVEQMLAAPSREGGLYHCVNAGHASWFDLASTIFALAQRKGYTAPRLVPVNSDQFKTKAPRPGNVLMNCERISRDFGISLRPWPDMVAEIIDDMDDRV